ncbi:hypothetical protein IQ266_18810 [filamentous cyanobacterium LEGE 11480]|uniref:Uncharacterized protein n=1 Tax=Romeriopsis navalis LEGE 11480 TaxID=2777977 RepID=A0A928Z4I0_9CYAN|nr:hypothetical protein [Romeriopsis navalis]MBE9031789.1 hypothetical protein [Romeriopsis navalis LEGE 11480]
MTNPKQPKSKIALWPRQPKSGQGETFHSGTIELLPELMAQLIATHAKDTTQPVTLDVVLFANTSTNDRAPTRSGYVQQPQQQQPQRRTPDYSPTASRQSRPVPRHKTQPQPADTAATGSWDDGTDIPF